jgi:poly(A) polymerase
MHRLHLEDPVLRTLSTVAAAHGQEIYVVGGYVRDLLLGRTVTDIDVSVVGDGIAFARHVASTVRTSEVFTYDRFGTAGLLLDGRKIEFVGTRRESYAADSRKPSVTVGTLLDDLRRRDFTVNAMAAALSEERFGELIDPFDGRGDLERRILRTPLEPEATFSDDPLRMLRAFRFSARLGFEIDPAALGAITTMRERIAIVSAERIRDELVKTIETDTPSVGFIPMQTSGLLAYIFPEFDQLAGVDQRSQEYPDGVRNFHHKDVYRHTLKVLDNLCAVSDNLWLRLAAILHDIAKPRTKSFIEGVGWAFHGHPELGARMVPGIFKRLHLPLERVPYVRKLVLLHLRPITLINEPVTDAAVRRLLFEAGEDLEDLLLLCRSDITSKNPKLVARHLQSYDALVEKMRAVEERDRVRNWQPPLRGEEIMRECGIPAGIAVGILKTHIEDAVLDGLIPNNHDAALEHLRTIRDEVLAGPLVKDRATRKKMLDVLPDALRQ